jgi:large repetitive protein
MAALAVVEDLDVVEYRVREVKAGSPFFPVQELDLHRGPKRFHSPWLGQVTSSVVDPSTTTPAYTGLNLTSSATYESGPTSYGRQQTSTKPAGAGTTATIHYYPDGQAYDVALGVTSPICGLPLGTQQFGMPETSTGPTNSSSGTTVTTTIYDLLGRPVGEESTGDAGWTCLTYDSRGRVLQTTIPDASYTGGSQVKTISYTSTGLYNSGIPTGDPTTTSIQDNGVIGAPTLAPVTTVTDLLGRMVQYTDVWGTLTKNKFNTLNQLTETTVTTPGPAAKAQDFTYDLDGDEIGMMDGGKTIATSTYTNGQLVAVSYPLAGTTTNGNGSSVALTYGSNGAQQGVTYEWPSTHTVSDTVVRSQSGRVLQDTIARPYTSTSYVSNYSYDAAGRLTGSTLADATATRNTATYSYAASGGCGANTAAGADGNRTGMTDLVSGSSITTSTSYCYDNADRLTGTSTTNAPTGADPAMNLSMTGTTPNALAYDTSGNTTKLGDQTLTYNQSNRNTAVSPELATGYGLVTLPYGVAGLALTSQSEVGSCRHIEAREERQGVGASPERLRLGRAHWARIFCDYSPISQAHLCGDRRTLRWSRSRNILDESRGYCPAVD